MTDVRYCTRCVISNQRPMASREYARQPGSEPGRMGVDGEGVCAACRVAETKAGVDWKQRGLDLQGLLAGFRRDDGRPDVLVPGSGGKDSVRAAHVLRDLGTHPLTVTWAPHLYTDIGRRNFDTWLRAGFDNITVTPNPKVHALLTRLAFLNLGHPFQPFVIGQRNLAPLLARRFGIDLVMFGELDDDYEGAGAGWQERRDLATSDDVRLSGCTVKELITEHGLSLADLHLYLPVSSEGLTIKALGSYIRWDPQEAFYVATEHGFESNPHRTEGTFTRYASIDDKLDPLHYWTMYLKFGVGRASHDASHEIRNGRLTREEGVALVHKYDGEEPGRYLPDCLSYMGLTLAEYRAHCDRLREARPWLWARKDGAWQIKHQVQ